jgi:hypothetical protein
LGYCSSLSPQKLHAIEKICDSGDYSERYTGQWQGHNQGLTSREGRDALGEARGEGQEGHRVHGPGKIPEQVAVPELPI